MVIGDEDAIPFGFAGRLYDSDTGLVRFGARDYDPVTGRWTGKNPIRWNGVQKNLLVYSLGDPINLQDSAGHDPTYAECIRQVMKNLATCLDSCGSVLNLFCRAVTGSDLGSTADCLARCNAEGDYQIRACDLTIPVPPSYPDLPPYIPEPNPYPVDQTRYASTDP